MRGQALAIFAISLTALMLIAALAFDTGVMLVERRDQQNAADAAAIAGARYLGMNTGLALSSATAIATANGFTNGIGSQQVTISVPPTSGPHQGLGAYIEVTIASTRPSVFGTIMGVTQWSVGARAVATQQTFAGPGEFSILALHPSQCGAMSVSGNGSVIAHGNIQVNSYCSDSALVRSGNGEIIVTVPSGACNVVGGIKDAGRKGTFDCLHNEKSHAIPDPLLGLPDPVMPALAPSMIQLEGSMDIPSGCPGSDTPATLEAPETCQFTSSYAGTTWRLFPGTYPGGLKLQGGTFYLEPGIYYIAGGGVDVTGTGTTTTSVNPGGTNGPQGGVMFFNTAIASGAKDTVASAIGRITLNGASADVSLHPLDNGSAHQDLIVYQDRRHNASGDDVTINGSDSNMHLRGLVYVPAGDVKVNGSGGTLLMDSVIASTFVVTGSTGSQIQALNNADYGLSLHAAGLVE